MEEVRKPVIITSDAGGTMTDLFIVDTEGAFSIGKAATTPANESIGYWESLEDAFSYWGIDLAQKGKEVISPAEVAIYTGTTMLNTLLQFRGRSVGVLITKGFEDSFTLERGMQRFAGYPYADRLHSVTHFDNPPLVPKKHMKGVTERIDVLGKEAIPLYEHEVCQSVTELLKDGVQALVIMFLYSYLNPSHEQAAAAIAREVMKEMECEVDIFLSSELSPIIRELARLNSSVIQAYAVEPVREQLFKIEQRLRDNDFRYSLQIVLSYGGLADIRHRRLYEGMVSGPVGGLLGASYIGEILGIKNMVTTDLGGTSFDIGLITEGVIPLTREPEFARYRLNLPMVMVDSIGAGCGSYIRFDEVTKRLVFGPDSAGAVPGPVCYDMGNEIPTLADCNLLLGILDPDYYLGGKVKLNVGKTYSVFKREVADKLNMDIYEAAEGVVNLMNNTMAEQVRSLILARGYTPSDYTLLGFGGAGPMHLAGYSAGMKFRNILTVPFAAAFSAFGCATGDYSHRHQISCAINLPPGASNDAKMLVGNQLNNIWENLEKEAIGIMKQEGFEKERVTLTPIAFIRYTGQLDDVEVVSPTQRITSPDELDRLINRYEDLYTKIYSLGATYPQAGFQILEVAVVASVPKVKPKIEKKDKGPKEPAARARKGKRKVYYKGQWQEAQIYEMDELQPGNGIKGLAVVEAPATTLYVPLGRKINVDEWGFIWMSQ